MRLVAGLLALTLTGSLAYADEAKAPEPQPAPVETARSKVKLRVVKMMPESHQALLFDKNRGTHVLVDVGSVIGTYTVMEIDEDEVTLSSAGRELILPGPAAAAEPVVAKKEPAADTKVVAPADPYAPEPITASQDAVRVASVPSSVPLSNPYDEAALDEALTAGAGTARPSAVTVTEMEVDPYAELAPAPAATSIETDPYADPEPAPAPVPAPVVKPAARPGDAGVNAFVEAMNGQVIVNTPGVERAPAPAPAPAADPATMLSRKELNTALADFGVLTASVRGSFTADGARLDQIAPGSVFAKAGLRNGDVITAVDGQPLKSIDDAADLYIRAGSVRSAKVQLMRAGKPMTLRLAIQ